MIDKSNQPQNLIQFLQTIAPYLNKDLLKEANALCELCQTFDVVNIKDLGKLILEWKKKEKKSPEGIASRVKAFIQAQSKDEQPKETLEAITDDFKKLSATAVKTLGKTLSINLVDKNDVDIFVNWIQTGTKPPTAEEKLQQELQETVAQAIQLLDSNLIELSQESIDQILDIAESVSKKHKIIGLKQFIYGLHYEPIGKSKKAMLKDFSAQLHSEMLSRFKMHGTTESFDDFDDE